jgi:hypothetical protein
LEIRQVEEEELHQGQDRGEAGVIERRRVGLVHHCVPHGSVGVCPPRGLGTPLPPLVLDH